MNFSGPTNHSAFLLIQSDKGVGLIVISLSPPLLNELFVIILELALIFIYLGSLTNLGNLKLVDSLS